MNFLEKLYKLMETQDISKNALCKKLKINGNSFVNWENRGTLPSTDVIIKLANYFDVTSDYLLDLDDEPNRKEIKQQFQITAIEKRLLEAFKNLSQNDKLIEIGRIELMAEQARNNVGTSDAAFAAKDNFMKVSAEKPTDTE